MWFHRIYPFVFKCHIFSPILKRIPTFFLSFFFKHYCICMYLYIVLNFFFKFTVTSLTIPKASFQFITSLCLSLAV